MQESAGFGMVDLSHISEMRKRQNQPEAERAAHLDKHDPYNLTSDTDLVDLINKTLTNDASKRPSAKELLDHKFITKWDNS